MTTPPRRAERVTALAIAPPPPICDQQTKPWQKKTEKRAVLCHRRELIRWMIAPRHKYRSLQSSGDQGLSRDPGKLNSKSSASRQGTAIGLPRHPLLEGGGNEENLRDSYWMAAGPTICPKPSVKVMSLSHCFHLVVTSLLLSTQPSGSNRSSRHN